VCSQYDRPAGVARSLQVSEYSIEPPVPNRVFNLLSKHNWRLALADETEHFGPEVPLVFLGPPFAGDAERLTGATAGPDGSIGGPSGQSKSLGPTGDTGEEMTLCESLQVFRLDIHYAPRVDFPRRDKTSGD